MDVSEALEVLGLGSDATQEEIKQSYYDLVKVWHPDQYRNHPRLLLKAEEELRKINEAKEILEGYTPFGYKARQSKHADGQDRGSRYQSTAKNREYHKPRDARSSNTNKSNTEPVNGLPLNIKRIGLAIFIIFLFVRFFQYIDRHSIGNTSNTVSPIGSTLPYVAPPSAPAIVAPAVPAPEPQSSSQASPTLNQSSSQPDVPVQVVDQSNLNTDQICRKIIVDFVNAEDNRKYDVINQYLSISMLRYWDLFNPNKVQIYNRYAHLWYITAYSKNTIKRIEKINDSTYALYTTFEYEGMKRHKVVVQESCVTFVFDDKMKIIEINGVRDSESTYENNNNYW